MIGFFPELFPDELLFSVCSRYAERSDYHSTAATRSDLFRSTRAIPSADFPSRLGILIGVLPPGHCLTTDRLINDHTLLPLFTPFLSAGRVSRIKIRMSGPNGGYLHGSLGVNTFPGKLKVFRYCPACVEEDRATYGETYWHRSHHIPGVNLCAAHKIRLRNTDARLRYSRSSVAFVTAEAALMRADLTTVHERNGSLLTVQGTLADDAAWLLRNPIFAGYQTNHRYHYVHLLYERGYCTYSGVLDRKKLANDFIRYYSRGFLETIKCEVVTDGREDWLNRLAHGRDRLIHPIHHLLLLQFLGQKPESFLSLTDPGTLRSKIGRPVTKRTPRIIVPFFRTPFGAGPWPCLNAVSDHFQQNVVTVCEVSSTQLHPRRPRGTFRCECGFAYSRVGPDQEIKDRYRLDNYVSFGERWENALREGVEKGETYIILGKRLRVNHKTMRREMIRLGLETANGRPIAPYHKGHQLSRSCAKLVDHRRLSVKKLTQNRVTKRRKFLKLRNANPELSRNQLHRLCSGVYVWLNTHDRAWLEEHLPEPHSCTKRRNSIWREKDGALAAAVQVEAERIRALPGRPVMISATSIAHTLEIANVWTKRPEVLPLTCKALQEFSETPDQFAVRRVEWAAAQFQKQGQSPSANRLFVFAGLSGRTAKKPAVKAALDRAVEFLKSQMDLDYSFVSAA